MKIVVRNTQMTNQIETKHRLVWRNWESTHFLPFQPIRKHWDKCLSGLKRIYLAASNRNIDRIGGFHWRHQDKWWQYFSVTGTGRTCVVEGALESVSCEKLNLFSMRSWVGWTNVWFCLANSFILFISVCTARLHSAFSISWRGECESVIKRF